MLYIRESGFLVGQVAPNKVYFTLEKERRDVGGNDGWAVGGTKNKPFELEKLN